MESWSPERERGGPWRGSPNSPRVRGGPRTASSASPGPGALDDSPPHYEPRAPGSVTCSVSGKKYRHRGGGEGGRFGGRRRRDGVRHGEGMHMALPLQTPTHRAREPLGPWEEQSPDYRLDRGMNAG